MLAVVSADKWDSASNATVEISSSCTTHCVTTLELRNGSEPSTKAVVVVTLGDVTPIGLSRPENTNQDRSVRRRHYLYGNGEEPGCRSPDVLRIPTLSTPYLVSATVSRSRTFDGVQRAGPAQSAALRLRFAQVSTPPTTLGSTEWRPTSDSRSQSRRCEQT